jgi:hypothetical protein
MRECVCLRTEKKEKKELTMWKHNTRVHPTSSSSSPYIIISIIIITLHHHQHHHHHLTSSPYITIIIITITLHYHHHHHLVQHRVAWVDKQRATGRCEEETLASGRRIEHTLPVHQTHSPAGASPGAWQEGRMR